MFRFLREFFGHVLFVVRDQFSVCNTYTKFFSTNVKGTAGVVFWCAIGSGIGVFFWAILLARCQVQK